MRTIIPFLSAITLSLLLHGETLAKQPDIGRAPEGMGPVSRLDPESSLMRAEAALGRPVSDFAFRNGKGHPVKISDFRGRPFVVSLVYTGCFDVCPTITNTISHAVEVARKALGPDSFDILSVGFDVKADTPDMMRSFGLKQGIRDPRWHFLSGDLPTVTGLAEELGFTFVAAAGGYEHMAMVTVVDQEGVIYRQVFGENFETPHLVEPLKELVFGTRTPFASVGDLVKKVKLFCTIYDPATNAYRFDWVRIFKIVVQGMIVLSIFWWVIKSWVTILRRERRQRQEAAANASRANEGP